MAAYKALFEAVNHFENNINRQLNRPTLLFIDEKDEFISCDALRDLIMKYHLDRWRLWLVEKDHEIGDNVSYHLIIDRESVGMNMWEHIKGAMARHLGH